MNRRVNEIATLLIEVVEYLESSFLAALARDLLPRVTKVQCTQTYRADVYSGCRGEYSVATKQALRWRGRLSGHFDVVCPMDV